MDIPDFIEDLKKNLNETTIEVTFTKQDGTCRVMRCTTNVYEISKFIPLEVKSSRVYKYDTTQVCRVFDTEIKDWRSFKYNSVISYRTL